MATHNYIIGGALWGARIYWALSATALLLYTGQRFPISNSSSAATPYKIYEVVVREVQ